MLFVRKAVKPCIVVFSSCALFFLISKVPNLYAEAQDDDDIQIIEQLPSKDSNNGDAIVIEEMPSKTDDNNVKVIEELPSKEPSETPAEESESSATDEGGLQHEICEFLSKNVRTIFNSVSDKKDISDDIDAAYQRLNDNYRYSDKLTDIADLSILSLFINSGALKNDKFFASESLSIISERLKSNNRNKYDDEKYSNMSRDSQSFAKTGKKTGSCSAEDVIFLMNDKILDSCPIKYDDNILVSLDDLLRISDLSYDIEYMDNNSTIIIKFDNNNLEIAAGSNEAFLNDIRSTIKVPVLNVKKIIYVSIDLARLLGCQVIEYDGTAVVY